MSNLTAGIHSHTYYSTIWKRISAKYVFFGVYLLFGTLWHLYEMSEIRAVRGELGANFTYFLA